MKTRAKSFSFSYRVIYAFWTKSGNYNLRKQTYLFFNSYLCDCNVRWNYLWGWSNKIYFLLSFKYTFSAKIHFHITWRRVWEGLMPFSLPNLSLPFSHTALCLLTSKKKRILLAKWILVLFQLMGKRWRDTVVTRIWIIIKEGKDSYEWGMENPWLKVLSHCF